MFKKEIKKITLEDKNYPPLLKKIKNPPKTLYYLGKLEKKENGLAVVGTRKCSSYGKEVTTELVSELSEAGLTIVSGLAPGIDTLAHQTCLKTKRETIAVLGTGLDEKSIYPKSNLLLAKKILEERGALISEYPPGTRGTHFTFPQRNRIISGLSLGVVVVEAKEKSGALITANFAFSQKRKVFAIPGSIYSSNSRGCHLLIKKGAKLIEKAEDILKELNFQFSKPKKPSFGRRPEEALILESLKEGALHINKIIEKTGLPAPKVVSLLGVLEVKGIINNLGGNIYAISHR